MYKEQLITSDFGSLKKVIVQPMLGEDRNTLPFLHETNLPGFTLDIMGTDSLREHESFRHILGEQGVQVLEAPTLINEAISNARENNKLSSFVGGYFPKLLSFMENGGDINAADLLGASRRSVFSNEQSSNLFRVRPLQWMIFSRDVAVALPKGILLTNFSQPQRKLENQITRFMFENSPQLQEYPIVFDAERKNVYIEGGDLMVFNNKTLLMGVDNVSSRVAAAKIAEETKMEVIAVNMPKGPLSDVGGRQFTGINSLFLHLDTIFNLVDHRKALIIPYLFNDDFAQDSPFIRILMSTLDELKERPEAEEVRIALDSIADIGKVTVYEPGTGREYKTEVRLENYLKQHYSYNFAYIGGEPSNTFGTQVQHFAQSVVRELRFQGGNVVALEPGKVVMYHADTGETRKSLQGLGVDVITFDGHELMRWNGGAHCLTCPLDRE